MTATGVDGTGTRGDGVDLDAVERALVRIPEVTAARLVSEAGGRIVEVHILSLPTKHAKQIVRDVQSVAMATFGLDLDRRIVSVVQLDAVASSSITGPDTDDADLNGALGALRINVHGVTADRNGLQCTARVVLTRGEQRSTGTAEGLVATSTVLRLVAQATVSALRHLEPAAVRADVETASIIRLGDRSVAVATIVVVVAPYEEVISGSAVVRSAGEFDAVARSVLDATNRRLSQLR
ncbi:MAG TPA: hypothetical protein VM143_06715 [Acidimicrobiales bacterium]|nr:hypothetical protein [Acidimicrobiales bacterium]